MNIHFAMRRAYSRLENRTPAPVDCWQFCGRRCCKGGEGDGMILFPGEDRLPAYFRVTDGVMAGRHVRFAVCPGRCGRRRRPLSCRIYPFAPYLNADGSLSIIPDPRAAYLCPLLAEPILSLVDRRFLRAVESAFRDLLKAEGVRPVLEAYSTMLDGYRAFVKRQD